MKASEVLKCAWELLKDRKAWAQHAMAYNENGLPVPPTAPEAVSWCLLGALRKCSNNHLDWETCRYLSKAIGHQSIAKFNDRRNRSHKTVLAKLAKAQALAKKNDQ